MGSACGVYTLVNERYGVVVYNEDAVAKQPLSFKDLLHPMGIPED